MCMGKTHAQQGVAAGIATATVLPPLIGTPLPFGLGTAVAILVTGAAVFPDIDHPEATIAHSFGPFSHAIAKAVHTISSATYTLTASRHDQNRDGGHRGITHTTLFAVLCGLATHAFIDVTGIIGLGITLFGFASFAVRALAGSWAHKHGWLATTATAAVITAATVFMMPPLAPRTAVWFGIAVSIGCLVHLAGDMLTEQGCPVFFPIPIRRKRWYMAGSPHMLRIRTAKGSPAELIIGRLSLACAGMLLFNAIPGSWAMIGL